MSTAKDSTPARAGVRKTYKLYVGGAFPRSESGYSYVVNDADGDFVANAALASRKDARDAVVAARKAFSGWSARTAYNRAQIVYRIAEVLEDRRAQFVESVRLGEGVDAARASAIVDESVDRLVWYAGWADKITQVTGSANPVAAPFFNLSSPEPTGVVAVVAPQASSLLGLVSVLAPVIVTGNTAVVITSYERPLPSVNLAEVLATSDVPGGVVNLLTGDWRIPMPWLAAHMDVNGLDLTGVAGDAEAAAELEAAGAENLKRVLRAPAQEPDWFTAPGIERMTSFLETKTVWHPIGI
ncbi:aldehyde dehydrogenase family protein [Nocardioides sp. Y6]|uniref:Aldehyde dehydrogenase family protein n=1 Tax=Nocardioides malaquae TaxID=2773426 RepID=A0ABR9RXB1_9ACTN|nr:aldehyde dehydrogenase family protein [Nocardioides malaquae]MBE7326015.1 aldehyde dehydrogenase family protein [Nocardioides malaquae]